MQIVKSTHNIISIISSKKFSTQIAVILYMSRGKPELKHFQRRESREKQKDLFWFVSLNVKALKIPSLFSKELFSQHDSFTLFFKLVVKFSESQEFTVSSRGR